MSEWIKCSDELPKLDKNVLTMLKDCDVDPIQIMSLTMCYTEEGWWSYWKTQEEGIEFEPDEIIAWQPLPEPYQEATIEPKRKTGIWMGSVCSECGNSTSFYYDCDYCPHCGAKMTDEVDG